ncbi:hypothetical protein [Clostridium aminobutyricum]|uniref:Uncharacterized protein n=1 Tax=Clostridium aminobutyricum TaxID=33953 RepID=A0A939IFS8_CLOAM|nr:hypothetical protein [Clostridium aminobutyricum]MBN7771835.1 hypothetical protein [Clostridium aminobutyricum]
MKVISMNDTLRQLLIMERTKKGWNKSKLSMEIGKANNFISLIESGTIKSIKKEDFKSIWIALLNLSQEEAEDYIIELINSESQIESNTEDSNKDGEIVYYDEENNDNNLKSFKKITDNIQFKFDKAFKNNSQYAFASVGNFMENIQFDIGFTLALIRIPFYLLKGTDKSVRQELFNDISDVVKKYLDKYVVKDSSEEKNNNEI